LIVKSTNQLGGLSKVDDVGTGKHTVELE